MRDTVEHRLVIGFAWYRPAQWQRVRDISIDAEDLHNTYLEWLQLAEEKLIEFRNSGLAVQKVDIDSEQLICWCNERGLDITGESRSQYAAERMKELDEKGSLFSSRT